MRILKRGLSIVLATLVLTMAIPFGGLAALAEDANHIVLGEDAQNNIIIEEGGSEGVLLFVPEESGNYIYYAASGVDTVGRIATSDGIVIAYNDDSDEHGSDFCITLMLNAGETYSLYARFYDESLTGSIPVYLVQQPGIDLSDIPALELNTVTDAVINDAYTRFTFTPEKTAYYAFSSHTTDGRDTYGRIMDRYENELVYNDDGGEEMNFRVLYELTAGVTYVLEAQYLDGSTGSFPVSIEETEVRTIQSITFHNLVYMENERYEDGRFEITPNMTVYYSDGSSQEINSRYVQDDLSNHYVNLSYEMDMSEWQSGGTYTVHADLEDLEELGGSFSVTIVGSPVVSVSVDKAQHIKDYHGWETRDSHYNEELDQWEYSPYYRCYDIHPQNMVITLEDGTVIEGTEFAWNNRHFSVSVTDPQTYENQFGVGVHTISASIAGYDFTYEMEIVESPVASIVVEPITMFENSDGYWAIETYWDEELQQDVEVEYFHYYNHYPDSATITMRDGTVYEDVRNVEWDGGYYGLSPWGQSAERHLSAGTNVWGGTVLGCEYTYEINIIPCPVVSVEVEPITLIEHNDGYWSWDWVYDEETGTEQKMEYFCYHNTHPSNATITLIDGTVLEDASGFYWNDEWHGISSYGQSYYDQLTLGTNTRHGSLAGFDFTYEVNIIESPVASVEASTVTLIENQNGYWNTSSVWDEELQQDVEKEWFYYHNTVPSLVITLKDGTVIHGGSFDWNGMHFGMSITNQWYENRLLPGSNTHTGAIAGYQFEYTIEIASLGSNDTFEYMQSSEGVIITDVLNPTEVLEIPAEIDGLPVIGVAGLGWSEMIAEVIFPDSVITIGDYVLNDLWNLQSVTFGAGVSNLTADMFWDCRKLQSIVMSEDNPAFMVVDGVLYNKAFDTFIAYPVACGNSDYEVPATVVNIEALDYTIYSGLNVTFAEGHLAFVSLDGVTYNKEMTKIISCSKDKTGEYVMPETVEEIASGAFMGTGLTSVVVSPKVTEIVYCVFASCASLESVTLPEGLVSIGERAFEEAEALTSIELPETMQAIGPRAFFNTGLTALTLPDSMRHIAGNAFANTDIATLDLGNGIVEIYDYAFAHTPVQSVVLPDSLMYLGSYAFYHCSQLTQLTMGSGLRFIQPYTFAYTGINELAIPENVGGIGEGAFRGSAITKLTLSEGVAEIYEEAFYDCSNLTAVHLPASLGYLETSVFASCDALVEMTVAEDNNYYFSANNCVITHKGTLVAGCSTSVIPEDGSVTMIGDEAFRDCDGLEEIRFPDCLVSIGNSAFTDCDGIGSIVIPDSVTYIGVYAFSSMDGLGDVKLGDGIEFMGAGAFAGCPMGSVDLGNSIPFIAPCAFEHTDLHEVFLPSSVTELMYNAFEGCGFLTSVEIPITVKSIEENVFGECSALTDVYYQGTEEDRANMYISEWGNEYLLNATWHYEWTNENWAEIPTCEHVYDDVCDEDCNLCGEIRKAPHVYDNACDTDCNECGAIREVPDHAYDNGCDANCNECGAGREVPDHAYDNGCDANCNECGAGREVPDHVYDNGCDANCNECGTIREVPDHVYDNGCDADCNECGTIREGVGHVYDNGCDTDCNECGTIREVAGHVYDDAYDTDCNECGAIREVPERPVFTVDSARTHPGGIFTVAVRTENNPGIIGLRLYVHYDASLFELIEATGKDFADVSFGPMDGAPFNMIWVDSINSDNVIDGVVALLTFRVKEDAALGDATISVTYEPNDVFNSAYENVPFETVDGTIQLFEAVAGDADCDGQLNVKDMAVMMQHLNGWDVEVDNTVLDVNRDDKVNNRDYVLIQRYLNGWDVTLQ